MTSKVIGLRPIGPSMLLQKALFVLFNGWVTVHYIYIYHADRHLGCFHVLATVNSAEMNIGVGVSFWIILSSRYIPRNDIGGSYL